MAFVYVIQSKERHIYVGCTTNLEKRLYQHNNKLAGWPKRGTNWVIILTEEYSTLSDARKRERWFKTGVSREHIQTILASGS